MRKDILRETSALRIILLALSPLTFDQRRRLLAWACERFCIDATRL